MPRRNVSAGPGAPLDPEHKRLKEEQLRISPVSSLALIGRRIRTDIGPRLAAPVATYRPVFGWESCHRSDRDRSNREPVQPRADLSREESWSAADDDAASQYAAL